MVRKLNEKNLVFSFRLAYLLMLMMGNTNLTFQMRIFDILNYVIGFFGIALLLLRVTRAKVYLKTSGIWLLISLIGLYLVSSILNYSYGGMTGFVSNGKATVWMACQMLLLYTYGAPSLEDVKKEFRVMCWAVTVFNFVSVLISYGMLITNYSKLFIGDDTSIMYGVVWNRLWGTFIDPNYGAVEAVVAILISAYLFWVHKNVWFRSGLIINLVLSVMYVVYSDSRTGMVVLAVGIVVYCFLSMFFVLLKRQHKLISLLLCAMISVVLATGVLGSFGVIKIVGLFPREVYLHVQSNLNKNPEATESITATEGEMVETSEPTSQPTENIVATEGEMAGTSEPTSQPTESITATEGEMVETSEPTSQPTENIVATEGEMEWGDGDHKQSQEDTLVIGRDESDMNHDISNRRFDIWMSGIEIVKESPLFGTTFRNLIPFAYAETPYTYIIHNENKVFWDLHNCFMNVLVCQGIPALVLFIVFVVKVLKKTLTYLLKKPRTMVKEQMLLISVLVVIAAAAMFNSMIMYVSSIETAIFWIFLGYCMQICCLEEEIHA